MSRVRRALSFALAIAAACSGRQDERAPAASGDVAGSAPGATATAGGAAVPGAPAGAAAGGCPATGAWAACSVIERLERAGLAPQRDSAAIRVEPLTQPGIRVTVGSAELDLFLYADAAARERDERRLDKKQFVEPGEQPTMRREATLIRSANLLAMLRSINDRQRERVADALTAGPPQAAAATPLPGARAR